MPERGPINVSPDELPEPSEDELRIAERCWWGVGRDEWALAQRHDLVRRFINRPSAPDEYLTFSKRSATEIGVVRGSEAQSAKSNGCFVL
jgi:hypothetical protein